MNAADGDSRNTGVFVPSSEGNPSQSDAEQPVPEQAPSSLVGVGADLPTGQSEQSRSKTGVLLLLLVVVIAGAVLYTMRRFGLGGELDLLELNIDYPVEDREQLVVEDQAQQQILEELERGVETMQIPLNDVKKNPFELAFLKPQRSEPEPAPTQRVSEEERRERERRQRIQQTLAELELDSILGGQVPVARISGELVREGDTVADLFTVRAIKGRSVELEVDGKVHVLAMGDP